MKVEKKDDRKRIQVVNGNFLFTLVEVNNRLEKKYWFNDPIGNRVKCEPIPEPCFMGYQGYALKAVQKIKNIDLV